MKIIHILNITGLLCAPIVTAFTTQTQFQQGTSFGLPKSSHNPLSSTSTLQYPVFGKDSTYLYAADVKGEETKGEIQAKAADEEDEEDEYEIVEYEDLVEADFYNSEWKVGTNWNRKKDDVDVTWVRLIVDDEGTNVAVWGDGNKGKWKLDESAQFISVSKETFGGWGGKKIWAGPMDDYYFMQGTVRGWNPISPASILGLWQMIRLGVDKDEAGIAPWIDQEEEEEKATPNGNEDQE